MRLTLRTLLAYRDGVLNSADSAELHDRIHQSEDASNLLRRVNRVVKDVNRKSTTLVGKGVGADPNSVSEYLDDALPSERVPELERICLENDEYLGELAGCHNLISSAMHTRVRIPDELKELARRIGDPTQAEQIKRDLADKRRQSAIVPAKPITRADKAAAGLKGPHFNVANAVDTSAAESGQAPGASGDPRTDGEHEEQQAAKMGVGGDGTEAVVADAPMLRSGGDSIRPSGFNLEGGALAREVPEYLIGKKRGQWMVPLAIVGLTLLLGVVLWQALGPWDRIQSLLAAGPPEVESDGPNASGEVASTGAEAKESSAASSTPEVPMASTGEDSDSSNVNESENAAAAVADDGEVAVGEAEDTSASLEDPTSKDDSTTVAVPDANPDLDAGAGGVDPTPMVPKITTASWTPEPRDGSSVGILLAANGDLRKLEPGVAVPSGDSLLVPIHNLLTMTTSDEAKVQALGPTRLIEFSESEKKFGLSLGRLLVTAGPKLSAVFGSEFGEVRLEFESEQSTAAIECGGRFSSYGSVLDSSAYKKILIVVADGPTKFILDGTISVELAAGEGVALVGNEKPKKFKLQSIPEWYGLPEGRPIDQEAVEEFAADLVDDGTGKINATLERLASHWRPEEAALAISACLMSDDWDVLFESGFLENPNAAIHVVDVLKLTREVLAGDPKRTEKFAKRWSDEWSKQDPKRNKTFDYLLGVPKSAVEPDQLNSLIDILDSESLTDRYIGYFELRRIFGNGFGFKPSEPNRASILSWRREAALGRLEPVAIPNIIRERVSP